MLVVIVKKKKSEGDKHDEHRDVDEGGDNEMNVEGGDVEDRGSGDSGAMQRGGERKKMVRPQRDRKSSVCYCEPDDDDDEYGNKSADSDVGSEYQPSDLDEENDFLGFEDEDENFSGEEEISDEEGERGRERRGHIRARSRRPSWARGGRRRMCRRGEGGDTLVVTRGQGRLSQLMT